MWAKRAGAGKTFISVLLVKAKHADIGAGEARRLTVFLAPKVRGFVPGA